MFFLATLWIAFFNLIVLGVALAWTPAFWSDAALWFVALPWRTFGTELGALLQMQAAPASAVWALWLCVSAVLLVGGWVAYALLKLRVLHAVVAPVPRPEVAAMFGQLSSSLEGLSGFGDLGGEPSKSACSVPVAPVITAVESSLAPSVTTAQDPVPAVLGAALQEIDPELGSSYDALVRELGWPVRPK